jgi:two-component system, NarL family, sensor kinase
MKTLKIIFVLLFVHFFASGQVNIDSLQNVAEKYPNDTASIHKLQDLASDYVPIDNNATLAVLKIAEKKMSDKTSLQMGSIYNSIANAEFHLSNMKVASEFYAKAKKIGESLADSNLLTKAYLGEGAMHFDHNQHEIALKLFLKALTYCKAENLRIKSSILGNIGGAYFEMSQKPQKVENYGLDNKKVIFDKKYIEKAIPFTRQSLEIAKKLKSNAKQILQSTNLAQDFMYLNQLDSAQFYIDFAEKLTNQENKPLTSATFYNVKGQFMMVKNDYNGALAAYTTSKNEAMKSTDVKLIYEGDLGISNSYENLKDYKKALEYYSKYTTLKDSVISQENYAAASDIQNKYESQKKENEILKLNEENVQKSALNKILLGSTFALLALGFSGYRNFKNRQKIAEQQQDLQTQKIAELEKDKQLQSVDAMLKGQEDERNRMAKDLHDGLGGMLSGVKMSFTNMKDNLIMSAENVGVFEQSISQLDNTIAELRKIAHNLMPEALVKFGLNDAVKDFCTSMMSATHINIVYENMGESRKLDNTANTYIYRIIQELINNAIKHGQPNQILVQLTTASNKILITVEDDGKGIDNAKLATSKGTGLTNIKHRVNYFKGNVTFENNEPQGTVVNIELNV